MSWLALFSVFFFTAVNAPPQPSTPKVVEPEIFNVVYYLDAETHQLKDLDRQTGKVKTKLRALGYGGARAIGIVEGETSTLALKAARKHTFVLRVTPGTDPMKFRLYVLKPRDGKREVELAKQSAFGTVSHGTGTTMYDLAKYGESSYKFILKETLTPGEYGFSPDDSQEVFSFTLVEVPTQ